MELWQRIAADAATHSRLPVRLGLTWRVGYGKQQSKTVPLPGSVSRQMRLLLLPSQGLAVMRSGVRSRDGCGDDMGPQQQQQHIHNSTSPPQQKSGGEKQQQQQQQQVHAVCQLLLDAFLGIVKSTVAPKQAKGNSSSTDLSKSMKQHKQQQQQGLGAGRSSEASAGSLQRGSASAGYDITRLVVAALYADGCL
jgi:hypothetical protein